MSKGCTRWDRLQNDDIRNELQILSINNTIQKYRLKWSQLDRMEDRWLPKVYRYRPYGTRNVGTRARSRDILWRHNRQCVYSVKWRRRFCWCRVQYSCTKYRKTVGSGKQKIKRNCITQCHLELHQHICSCNKNVVYINISDAHTDLWVSASRQTQTQTN